MHRSRIRLIGIIGAVILSKVSRVLADEGVLLDTRQETQELDWPKIPKTGAWDESSVNSAGKDYRQLMVCNIAKSTKQDNWVRTKFIKNSVGAQLLYVDISFSVRSCHDLRHVKSCKESFSLHFLESNDESLDVSYNDFNKFKFVDTIAAEGRFDPGNVDHAFNFKTRRIVLGGENGGDDIKNGFYLALRDRGACLSVQYIKIYYKYCPEVSDKFVRFPITMTSRSQYEQVAAKGECIDNAVLDRDKRALGFPIKYCTGNGIWSQRDAGGCYCDKGFEESAQDKDKRKCIACTNTFYKAEAGSDICRRCPLYSHTNQKSGAIECECQPGYYRAPDDDISQRCTKPPGSVTYAQGRPNGTSVKINWNEPRELGGRSITDLKYQVQCAICESSDNSNSSKCKKLSACSTTNRMLTKTSHRVHGLEQKTIYRFRIYAYNSVSQYVVDGRSGPSSFFELFVETEERDDATQAPPLTYIPENEDIEEILDPTQFNDGLETENFSAKQLLYIFGGAALLLLAIMSICLWVFVIKKQKRTHKPFTHHSHIPQFTSQGRNLRSGGFLGSSGSSTGTAESRLNENATLILAANDSNMIGTRLSSNSPVHQMVYNQMQNQVHNNIVAGQTMNGNIVQNIAQNPQNSGNMGTIGTNSWQYRAGEQLRGYMGAQTPISFNNSHLAQINEIDSNCLTNIVEIENFVSEEARVCRANMQLEERLDMPVSIIDLKNNTNAAKMMDVLSRSKQCPFILKIEGKLDSTTVITEDIINFNLRDYLKNNDITVNQKLSIVYQCCQAVEYAHSVLNHTFGSLKLENFGVTEEGEIRLIWFEKEINYENSDFVKYLPPTVSRQILSSTAFSNYIYTHENDVWQFGILVWEILSETEIFEGIKQDSEGINEVLGKLESGMRLTNPNRQVPTSLYNLMLQTWDEIPVNRPVMGSIVSEVRRIVTGATTRKRKPIVNNKLKLSMQARSYSSIGTLETSSNEGNHHKLKTVNNSKSSSPAKLEVVVPNSGENKVDIRLLDRGTTIEV